MKGFSATIKFDPHFFVFNRLFQTILVAFSMKTSRANTDMLSSVNEGLNSLKTEKNTKSTRITCTIFPGSRNCYISPNQTVVDQKHELFNTSRTNLAFSI